MLKRMPSFRKTVGRPVLSVATLATLSALTVSGVQGLSDRANVCVGAPGQLPVHGDTLPPVIEVVSWNMQKAANAGWNTDLASLGSSADLVFLQEASLQAAIPEVLTNTVAGHFAPGYRNRQRTTGVMTLSAAKPSFRCNLSVTEPWLRTPKAASVTEYLIAGRDERLLSVNLHAVNFSLGLERLRDQLGEVGTLLHWHAGPVIVAGDLNTWRKGRQALVDAFMVRHNLTPVSFTPDLRSTALGRALDHIYVRGIEVKNSEVVPMDSSDHNALRAELRLQ